MTASSHAANADAALLLTLDAIPVLLHATGRLRFDVAEDVRVAAHELLVDQPRRGCEIALAALLEEEREIIGPDWFPYGIEPNRPTIEALLQYTHEHGLTDRRVKLEELFAPATMRDIPLTEGQHV